VVFLFLGRDEMKHEDVPGYIEMRAKLFQIRFELQVTKDEDERKKIREELKQLKRQMARLLLDHNQEERKRGK
jgi:hypothetical protein